MAQFDIPTDGDLLVVPVKVAGTDFRFWVDTGASCTVFDSALKHFLGAKVTRTPIIKSMVSSAWMCSANTLFALILATEGWPFLEPQADGRELLAGDWELVAPGRPERRVSLFGRDRNQSRFDGRRILRDAGEGPRRTARAVNGDREARAEGVVGRSGTWIRFGDDIEAFVDHGRTPSTQPPKRHPDDTLWYDRFPRDADGAPATGAAVIGVYTCGGTVFTSGTTDSSHGLTGDDPIVERITRNVLDRLGGKYE